MLRLDLLEIVLLERIVTKILKAGRDNIAFFKKADQRIFDVQKSRKCGIQTGIPHFLIKGSQKCLQKTFFQKIKII